MGDPTLSQLIGGLLGYGPQGVAFSICFFVIYTLYQRNTVLNDKLTDVVVTTTVTNQSMTTALNSLTDVIKAGKAGA